MSYNYNPLFQNGKVSSQTSIYNHNPLRQNTNLNRYNSNSTNHHHNSTYIRFIPVNNGKSSTNTVNITTKNKSSSIGYNNTANSNSVKTQSSKNRLSMFNYEFLPENHYQHQTVTRKNSFDTKSFQTDVKAKFANYSTTNNSNSKYVTSSFGSLSPKTLFSYSKRTNPNFSSLNTKKVFNNLNTNSSNSNSNYAQNSNLNLTNSINTSTSVTNNTSINNSNNSSAQNYSLNKSNGSEYSSGADSSSLLSDLEFEVSDKKNNSNYISRIKKTPVQDNSNLSTQFNYDKQSSLNVKTIGCLKINTGSTESLQKQNKRSQKLAKNSIENYDNHHYIYNQYQLNTNSLYQKQLNDSKNFQQIQSEVNNLTPNSQITPVEPATYSKSKCANDETSCNLKYNKFSFYNRIEDNYSSNDSINKLNTNLEGLKSFFNNKCSSLYYDSGIGADVSTVNTVNLSSSAKDTSVKINRSVNTIKIQNLDNSIEKNSNSNMKTNSNRNLNCSTANPETIIKPLNATPKKLFQSETLNPNLVRNLKANLESSSSFSSTDSTNSSSSPLSSSFSNSSNKQRKRLDSLFQSLEAKKTAAKFNTLNQMTRNFSFRETKINEERLKNLEEGSIDNKVGYTFNSTNNLTTSNKADFTPHLLKNNGAKNGNSVIRKLKIPPPPTINKINNTYPTKGQTYPYSPNKNELIKATYDNKINIKNQFDSISSNKQSINNLSSNISSNGDNYYLSPLLYGKNIRAESKDSINLKNNNPIISNQIYSPSKIKHKDKKCIATKDYLSLYSKNLNLTKGEKYTILSKNNENWCLVRDKVGNTGYAPSNYLEFASEEKIIVDSIDKSHYGKEWFHGNITRSEAYSLLVGNQNFSGTYLIRNNSTEKGKYTLCVYKNGKVYNYKINVNDSKYYIDLKYKFNSLVDLIEFYQKNPAGLVCNLKYPAEKSFIDKKTLLDSLETVYKKFIIERNDIEFYEKIGSGQFGIVLKAEYKQRKIVAVKKMKPGSKEDEMNFNREAEFMMKLQNLQVFQHRNLVQLYGLSKDLDDSILIVTEFVKYGSLYNYLLKNKERILNSKSRFLRLVNICMDVCDGMEYLESKHIIHRDLATRNCLVGEGEVIKVADFGLARFTDDCYIAHPQSQFPVKWSAPEVIKYRSYSSKSDVWSFSCLMYEVFTLGKMPYGGSTTNSVAAKQIITGIIPERPSYCPLSLYENIMTRAWNKDPKDRPNFKELLKLLGNFT